MSVDPVVSVSITTYQHAAFIRQCLDSVLMQETTFPFEILLGEDDSTDGTREVCKEYAAKYPDQIRLFLHHRKDNLVINGRATGRLNLVNNLQQACGRYIALLDGDDYWTNPSKLQRQFDALETDPAAAGCFHDCLIVNEIRGTERPRIGDRPIDTRADVASLIRENNIATGSMFVRNTIDWNDLPRLFFETLKGDYLFALLVARTGPWIFVDRIMSVYRVHQGGLWSGAEEASDNCRENVAFFQNLMKTGFLDNVETELRSRINLDYRRWAVAEARSGRVVRSIDRYFRSLGAKDRSTAAFISTAKYLRTVVGPIVRRRSRGTISRH